MNPFSGKPKAEIIDRWLRIVEDILDQIQKVDGLKVNYATRLFFDRAWSWFTIRSRRPVES